MASLSSWGLLASDDRWQQKVLPWRDPGAPNTLAPRIFLGFVHILAKVSKTNP